jgi:EAL domain-containing protein (putative c-di-GMP-specific phosphodiesterase class I)
MILGASFQLVAEGIETEELKAKVITMGATHLQGFLLGRPGVLTTTQASDLGYKSDAMHTGTHFQPC